MKKKLIALPALCLAFAGFAQDETSKPDTLITAYSKLNKFNGAALVARNGVVFSTQVMVTVMPKAKH